MKVNVSTLREYEFCPRAVYLKGVLNFNPKLTLKQFRGLVSHAVRKEMSMRKARLLRKAGCEEHLPELICEEFDKIMADLPLIYRQKLSGVDLNAIISEVKLEVESELELLSNKLKLIVKEYGLERAIELMAPWKVEYRMYSDSIGFSGVVDKVLDSYAPVGVKTGRVGGGVWDGDKMQLCAYAMLLEERFNTELLHGFVEYTRVQEQRPVVFTEGLRRRVLEVRDCVMEVLSGSLPEICPHGSGRKCSGCSLNEACYNI